ncbi:S8/S53 family peptidase [Svornostia abyssi]|uniref:S8/S53 family peptidase n=1 Tax=Svornostia abyssi TaxID=2898438 RepID=A0ABY5PBM5_9ACTN|nr:S8/S53 family peptidase [Parviterribacteraceae bacterium J379]
MRPPRTALGVASIAACLCAAPAASADPRVGPQVMFSDALTLPDVGPGAAPVTVCVVDSGADPDATLQHALTARLGVDAPTGFTNFVDDRVPSRHGTSVSQVIAGTSPVFRAGVWPHAKLRSVGVSHLNASAGSSRSIGLGLDACLADPQVRVINLSMGNSDGRTGVSATAAIERARQQNVNVVVAAGNDPDEPVNDYASLPGVLSAAGVGLRGERCGSTAAAATLIALSCRVGLTDRTGERLTRNGTSFAAPQVSAVLAAIRAHAPQLSADQAAQALVAGASPGALGPMLNARGAMRQVGVALPLTPPLAKPRIRVLREGSKLRIAVTNRPRASVTLVHRLPFKLLRQTQRPVIRIPVGRQTTRITFERAGIRSKPSYVAVRDGKVTVY